MRFPKNIITFIRETPWTFAKTYAATWPHEYLCIKYIDDKDSFYNLVQHIRMYSHEGRFYKRAVWYFQEDGYTYWTMAKKEGENWNYSVEDENIVNRCRNDQTYEYRKEHRTLPEDGIKGAQRT